MNRASIHHLARLRMLGRLAKGAEEAHYFMPAEALFVENACVETPAEKLTSIIAFVIINITSIAFASVLVQSCTSEMDARSQ